MKRLQEYIEDNCSAYHSYQPYMDDSDEPITEHDSSYYQHFYVKKLGFKDFAHVSSNRVSYPIRNFRYVGNLKVFRIYKDHMVFCPSKSKFGFEPRMGDFSDGSNICDPIPIVRLKDGIFLPI